GCALYKARPRNKKAGMEIGGDRGLYDLGAQAGFQEFGTSGLEFRVFPGLHRTFAVIMDDQGTLFGLFEGMLTDIDQGRADTVKRVDIIADKYCLHMAYRLFLKKDML